MRALFLLLLAACLSVFAWQQGYFGELPPPGREPERLSAQIAPEQLVLLAEAPRPAPVPAPAVAQEPTASSCLEWGDFEGADLTKAREALAELKLGASLSARSVEGAGWYMVYLPPLRNRAEAEKRAEDLRNQGLRDVGVIGEGALRNGLVLGSFRELENARDHAAALEKRGVKGARVPERPGASSTALRFTIKDADPALRARLETLASKFPQHPLKACAPAS